MCEKSVYTKQTNLIDKKDFKLIKDTIDITWHINIFGISFSRV